MPSMPMFMMPACSVSEPPRAASATGVALRSICWNVPAEKMLFRMDSSMLFRLLSLSDAVLQRAEQAALRSHEEDDDGLMMR